MVYLDSNVFVYAVTHDPASNKKAKKAISILRDVEESRTRGVTSLLTWDELAWVVSRLEGREAGIRAGATFLKLQNLTLLAVSLSMMIRAQELIERYQLKPRDAIHVSTALTAGEREIISDDAELDIVREIRRRPLG
ncbi:MAG: type II toxin-antitoxin system VapC family toxin [Thaumarchaeota archaeon]|nr:type II toxin-antitoxin system VapC family toxin [Nitrososphaerota archaeon]MBI3116473.1 type II toxin-antitoxin system VapC family toxin [Nitrososphaerota archaeon]